MDTWRAIDQAEREEARRLLARACGATRWIERMLARRPFGSREALLSAARVEWDQLSADDWREAFSHHPKIGDREELRQRFPTTHDLSSREQAGLGSATEAVLDALAEGNQRYEDSFGYIFIVCASGLSANEMLAKLTDRLGNDPAREILIAAGEQAKITALRLGNS
jgi:2-oxo-4-hydroxy-4-carboxy-5-ureidoimidazoline decarboxylase